jgi:hypothetical protein
MAEFWVYAIIAGAAYWLWSSSFNLSVNHPAHKEDTLLQKKLDLQTKIMNNPGEGDYDEYMNTLGDETQIQPQEW